MSALRAARLATNDPAQALHEQTTYAWVPLGSMFAAPYERPLSEAKVEHLLAHWDPRAVGVLYLAERVAELSDIRSYAILDGRHRKEAAARQGFSVLPALIYTGLSYEDEAALYVLFATVHQQTALDRFRARLEAGDPVATRIQTIAQDVAGLALPLTTGVGSPGYLNCVNTLERLYTHFGAALLIETCRTLREVWANQQRAWNASMVNGMTHFLARYQDHADFDRARLVTQLRLMTPETIYAEANLRTHLLRHADVRSAVGLAILDQYNAGLRAKKLPDWQTRVYTQTQDGGVISFDVEE